MDLPFTPTPAATAAFPSAPSAPSAAGGLGPGVLLMTLPKPAGLGPSLFNLLTGILMILVIDGVRLQEWVVVVVVVVVDSR